MPEKKEPDAAPKNLLGVRKTSDSGPSNRRGSFLPTPEELGRRPSLMISDGVCIHLILFITICTTKKFHF